MEIHTIKLMSYSWIVIDKDIITFDLKNYIKYLPNSIRNLKLHLRVFDNKALKRIFVS